MFYQISVQNKKLKYPGFKRINIYCSSSPGNKSNLFCKKKENYKLLTSPFYGHNYGLFFSLIFIKPQLGFWDHIMLQEYYNRQLKAPVELL